MSGRTWNRARGDLRCGRCDGVIPAGAAYATILLGQGLRRCQACAGEPVPADLPELPDYGPATPSTPASHVARPLTPIAQAAPKGLPFDGRMAAAGKDE